ncbi:hypothetical protein [Cupriavidus sp. CuC1]|uniref:hypothetical protein n=1 Tax=Cupriavidus sp. CuC1 TaxID=3373131 RepID=UPI0037D3F2ED
MTLSLLAVLMAAFLLVTVATAIWRCSHPYRIRYRRCAEQRKRAGICRQMQQH